jgi:L-2-amino-thiazoline-4-carboxylic acid hydrolase
MNDSSEVPISHLQRRKIEGRVLLPLLRTLKEKFGEEVMHDVLDTTISRLAAEDGAAWAASHGQTIEGLRRVALEVWAGSGALDVQLVGESADHLDFNVTRCRYAEFYRDQGLSDVGYHIHCNRDLAMVTGFNDQLELNRSQTIMQGAPCCDFRFRRKAPDAA